MWRIGMDNQTRAQVRRILEEAEQTPKPCGCRDYEAFKAKLLLCGLTDTEYKRAIRALCDVLEV